MPRRSRPVWHLLAHEFTAKPHLLCGSVAYLYTPRPSRS